MRYLRFVLCFLLLGMPVLFASSAAFAQVAISVTIAPPELPVYEQPICPGGLHLDSRLLGLGRRRLLLGAWHVGAGAASRLLLDSPVLGLGRFCFYFPRRILGPGGGLLRWN
jgi:hypothetical protein